MNRREFLKGLAVATGGLITGVKLEEVAASVSDTDLEFKGIRELSKIIQTKVRFRVTRIKSGVESVEDIPVHPVEISLRYHNEYIRLGGRRLQGRELPADIVVIVEDHVDPIVDNKSCVLIVEVTGKGGESARREISVILHEQVWNYHGSNNVYFHMSEIT